MRKNTKTIMTAISLCAVAAFGLTACGSSGSSSDAQGGGSVGTEATSDVSVGIVLQTAYNAHFQDIAYGAVLAGQENGITVRVDNTAAETEVEEQITKCENMISSGVKALILTPNDTDAETAAVNAAHDAGIPFIVVDTEITNIWGDDVKEYMPSFIGVDHEETAYEIAKDAIEHIGGSGNAVILRGTDAQTSSQLRTAGFERAVEESGITVLESQSADFVQDEALTTMSDILQRYKDIDLVLCCNDLMAIGAISALEENGFAVGEDGVTVVGIDGNLIALQSIADGKLYSTSYDWSIMQGYYAVEQCLALMNGEEVPERTITPSDIVTIDNVDEYMQHGEELAAWKLGEPIDGISDYMKDFIQTGKEKQE